jgi:Fe-S-cluster containining protein
VWVTLPEIYRIAEFLGIDDYEFTKRYVRKVHQKFSLIEMPNGDCVFYDKGCKIYPVRPTQCRTFPFWPEIVRTPASWKVAATECPGMNEGRTFSESEIEKLSNENHS